MIRKGKGYVRPKKLYEKSRINEENTLVNKYGLKNKREIWKTIAKVSYYRRRAKSLAKSTPEEQEVLFSKLKSIGLKAQSIADVLALNVEDILRRRLPTIIAQNGLAQTVRQARQMVVHKNILIDDNVVNIPSYIVSLDEESKIKVKVRKKVAPKSESSQSTTEDDK